MNIEGLGEIAELIRRFTVLVEPGARGNGSGVVWSSTGLIVTNAHVVRGPHAQVTLWDGREFRGQVIARDVRRDLAALCIPASGLAAATAADSSRVRAGEVALAVGNPLGFLGALTMGVVHCVAPLCAIGGRRWVQADIRLAPGNSGGPLADAQGRVIGINTMVAGKIALAVPSNEVCAFLQEDGGVQWLGVQVTPVRLPRVSASRVGLLLLGVEPESPAAKASLLPGDILIGTEQSLFTSADDLATTLQGTEPRDIRFRFLRGDYRKIRRVSVALPAAGRASIAA